MRLNEATRVSGSRRSGGAGGRRDTDDNDTRTAVRVASLRRSVGFVNLGFGRLEDAPVYADQFQIYHATPTRTLPGRSAVPLGMEPGPANVLQVREREHLVVQILDNVREKDVSSSSPRTAP